MIKALIVEDSRLARNELMELLRAHPDVNVCEQCASIRKARSAIEQHKPDLLFLDINLPGGDGFELLESLDDVPAVIFTTAYDEYALKAFDHNALDYLLKPITPESLARGLSRLENQIRPTTAMTDSPEQINRRIFVRDGDRCWLIDTRRIRYFESSGNYARIHFDEHKPMVYRSLSRIESRLPSDSFVRVSRQYIVNLNEIVSLEPWNQGLVLTMSDGREIDVSRRHSQALKEKLSL